MARNSNFLADSLNKARSQQAAYVLLCVGFAVLLISRGPASLLRRDIVSIVSAAAATLSFMQFRTLSAKAGRLSAGASAEKAVAKSLASLRIKHVLHSVDLSAGGDADHIVVGETLAVVETKTGRGYVRADGSKLYAGSKTLPGSPVSQAKNQARAVRKKTGVWATAVVCVTNMDNEPFRHQDVIVCSMRDLPETLRQVGGAIPEDMVSKVLSSLGVPNLRT